MDLFHACYDESILLSHLVYNNKAALCSQCVSYLPSIIAMTFCRGLSTSQKRGAGRALTGAEVWKWRVRAGPEGRGEVVWGLIWKRTVLPLLQNRRGG